MLPNRTASLRSCICETSREVALFACDVTSQPRFKPAWRAPDPAAPTKCARALPLARRDDLVLLRHPLDEQYHDWLLGLGLSSKHVLVLEAGEPTDSLAQRILKQPEPALAFLETHRSDAVYVPFFAGESDILAAQRLGVPILGCQEEVTLRFFNKEAFKDECRTLGLPTVEGAMHDGGPVSAGQLEQVVTALLETHSRVIVRPTMGGTPSQISPQGATEVSKLVREIAERCGSPIMIEPLFNVIASPNDQWCITRSRRIEHLGMSVQLFDGLTHIGNVKGQVLSDRITNLLHRYSAIIVQRMRELGYCGVLSLDYIVTESGLFLIQNNARLNGSTFAFGIVENLEQLVGPLPCWKFFRAAVAPCNFSSLLATLSPVVFDGIRKNSVFPFDSDDLPRSGAFTALVVGEDMYHLAHLEGALKSLGVIHQ